MKRLSFSRRVLLSLCFVLTMLFSMSAWASSDDNSLYDLGITTEGVTVEPEFTYSTWEYDVVVPAGTTALELSPVASSEQATISDVSGTTLDADGNATVLITVTSGSGIPFTYTLHVTSAAAPVVETEVQTEAQTEPQTEAQTEPQTEDSQYVKVDRNTIQEAENTITDLKGEITELRETISLYTKIMYALIGVSVVLLFIVINLLLRKKDLKAELNDYRSYGYAPEQKKSAKREKRDNRPAPEKRPSAKAPEQRRNAEADVRAAGGQQRAAQPNARRVSNYQPDQDLEVTPQMSRKPRTMPAYEEENVVRQAAQQSKSEDAARRQAEAAKRQEEAAAKAAARAQEQEAKAAAKQAEKQRRAEAKEEAARAKEEQRQSKKRRGGAEESRSEDSNVKIDLIDL